MIIHHSFASRFNLKRLEDGECGGGDTDSRVKDGFSLLDGEGFDGLLLCRQRIVERCPDASGCD